MTRRNTTVEHEPCGVDGPGAERLDADGDGRPDVIVVREEGSEVCRAVDLNLDGIVDVWVYRDPSGSVRRREHDFDRDGRIDEVAVYTGGTLTEKHRATTFAGRLDTWHYYEGGRLARTERDANGDAVIDEWWEYPKPDRPECPLIHSDVNGDGRPDPGASVDVCEDGSGYRRVEPMQTQPKGFDFEGPAGQLPREVEEEPAESEAAPSEDEGAPP